MKNWRSIIGRNKQVDQGEYRTIHINTKDQNNELDQTFVSNVIKTSKYTTLNFLPKNLFGQFRRIANFYFLCLCIIHFSIDSPVSPITTLLPLLFVVLVTGLKQGYEDWKRHKQDNKVNNALTTVWREGKMMNIQRADVVVGDFVEVAADEEFPCDILLLNSSDSEKKCDVTTANLDGETNLKTFTKPAEFHLVSGIQEISAMRAIIECQFPNTDLYDFKGRMIINYDDDGLRETKTISLNTDNLLLRGARLKNTEYILGCAIYTGKDTKMAMNLKMTDMKFSTVEKTMNKYLIFYLFVLLAEVFVCTILEYRIFDVDFLNTLWYLTFDTFEQSFGEIIGDSFSFFILFSYIIPISLYVTLEMQKFLSTFFFEWDEKMVSGEERAVCNTSDLNEELGQVQYLFSDKTGTLTENIMEFRQCSIMGTKFHGGENKLQSMDRDSLQPPRTEILADIEDFLLALSLCHTVKAVKSRTEKLNTDDTAANKDSEDIEMNDLSQYSWQYFASSPDEKALVEACARYGVIFEGEHENECYVNVQQTTKSFTKLKTLEFDSDRKMMSVIVRDNTTRKIWLFTKGAESSVVERCREEPLSDHGGSETSIKNITLRHIEDFAMMGLRTLAIAKRQLSETEYTKLGARLDEAKKVITDRDVEVLKATEMIECNLTLLGATAVEDQLQDEVPETLQSLYQAGIKTWVLTGDKVETAVNVALLCGLFKRNTHTLYLTNLKNEEDALNKLHEYRDSMESSNYEHIGLVVDGISMLHLIQPSIDQEFFNVCSECAAVVCCRMTPKQKAEVVHLVKKIGGPDVVCAAIGDGANDVSMIQEAHVGLGIVGKEGRQAVRCSDFAFGQFKFLKRALLVHGHWYYTRVSTLVLYCFYKNVAFITPQVFYQMDSGYSTQSVYEGMALTMINVTFTALPIIILGLFEQTHNEKDLLEKPALYRTIANNKNMNWRTFVTWSMLGLWHAGVVYYGLQFAVSDSSPVLNHGYTYGLYLYGIALTTAIVAVINLKLVIESRYQTWFFIGSILLTWVGFYLLYLIYTGCFTHLLIFWTFYELHKSLNLLLTLLLVVTLSLLPDIIIVIVTRTNEKKLLL